MVGSVEEEQVRLKHKNKHNNVYADSLVESVEEAQVRLKPI